MEKNKELAKKIADEGEYMPGPEEWNDLCALENAGMVETPVFIIRSAPLGKLPSRESGG
jgi:hypothetical protein